MKVLYETRVTASGGRNGRVISDDGLLDLRLTPPKALGGTGDASNPEQLFAAGYAACFENAVIHVARQMKETLRDEDVVVSATVGIGSNEAGGFCLSVTLDVAIAGLTEDMANQVIRAAHAACPYSNAIRGNIDVAFNISVSPDSKMQA